MISAHSAGGHLAAMVLWAAAAAPCLASVVAVSGLFELDDVRCCYANEALQLTEAHVAQCSPTTLLRHPAVAGPVLRACPVLVAMAQHDTASFRAQSVVFADLLRAVDAPVTFVDLADRDHFDIVERLRFPNDEFTRVVMQFVGLA